MNSFTSKFKWIVHLIFLPIQFFGCSESSQTMWALTTPSDTTSGMINSGNSGGLGTNAGSISSSGNGVCSPAMTFTPSSGSVGTFITISGADFSAAQTLSIGGVSGILISQSNQSLVGMVMPGAFSDPNHAALVVDGNQVSCQTFAVTGNAVPAHQQGLKLVGTGAIGRGVSFGVSISLSEDGNTALVGGMYDNNTTGAAWVYTRTGGVWTQQGSKLVGTGSIGDSIYFGLSVSLSADGNTALVGGPGDNNYAGAAWVYTCTGGVWTQQGSKLVGTEGIGSFGLKGQGASVALSGDGNTALLGSMYDNGSLGAVWVFTRTNGVWSQQGSKLLAPDNDGHKFGHSVSLNVDGNTALISGIDYSTAARVIWVFTRSPEGVWTQQGPKLDTGSPAFGYVEFGTSVSLSADGNTALVGNPEDNNVMGAVWVFTRTDGVWTQQGSKLVGTGSIGTQVYQGAAVALSGDGNTVWVGGYQDNHGMGAAWVFTRTDGVWTQQGSKLVGMGAFPIGISQSYSVSMSADGNTALMGGPYDNNYAGAAWVFTRGVDGAWAQQSKLVGTGGVGNDIEFGTSVSLSADGNTALMGGPSDNDYMGAAWVFRRSPEGVWTQQGPKLVVNDSLGSSGTGFGMSVSMSADGNTALVGGSYDNDYIGAAWVFTRKLDTSTGELFWSQQSKLIGTGGIGSDIEFGTSVSLSADGNTALIGGYYDSDGIGAAWVFTRNLDGSWFEKTKLVGTEGVGTFVGQGYSVSMSADGNTALMGGPYDNDSAGATWVFTHSADRGWVEQSKLVGTGGVGVSMMQGNSVSMSADGNTALVGGSSDNINIGATWVFTRSADGGWVQQSKLVGIGSIGQSGQGSSVSLSRDGNTALVGGPSDSNSIGASWVFAPF